VTVTLKQVEDALASVHPLSGVIVRAGGKVVATQEPRPWGTAASSSFSTTRLGT
jgi:hypothetical protein